MLKTGLANIVLRGLSLVSKFVLLASLAKWLSEDDVGLYGLFDSTVIFSVGLIGLEFRFFSTREIVCSPLSSVSRMVRDQYVFYALCYPLIIPLVLGVFVAGVLPWSVVGWFFPMLILSHSSQELQRILIAIRRPLQSTLVLLVRGSIWVYVLVGWMWWRPETRRVDLVWGFWLAGLITAHGVAAYCLGDLGWRQAWSRRPDTAWIKKGLGTAMPFLAGTLCMLGISTADRYALKLCHGDFYVGIYTFFISVAFAIPLFVDTGIVTLMYPRIVAAYHHGRVEEYRRLLKKMTLLIVVLLVCLSLGALVGIRIVLMWLGKASYQQYAGVFWPLLAAAGTSSLAFVPTYALYARQKDRSILLGNFTGLTVALVGNYLLVPRHDVYGAAFATLAGLVAATGTKFGAWMMCGKDQTRVSYRPIDA